MIALTKQSEQCAPETISYLLMYYHSSLIWLSTRLDPTQRVFDEFTHHFHALISHAEAYIDAKATEKPTFTFEVGAVPPLYLTAIKCRVPSLRRQALDLLNRAPRKECIFGASSTAEVACRLIEIEEEYLVSRHRISAGDARKLYPMIRSCLPKTEGSTSLKC